MVLETMFFAAVALIVYAYVGYPVLMFIISRLFPRPVRRAEILPKVSIVITAYNESRDMAAKLENTLALDYPAHLREVIVASDGSTDATNVVVERFRSAGVGLKAVLTRSGKTVAQGLGVAGSTGEVLVFSDATTRLKPDALRMIVRAFADPEVGCVAGRLVYESTGRSVTEMGCRVYWAYERALRGWESRAGSLIGVSGCFYAVRRSAYARLSAEIMDDFGMASEMKLLGLRTVYETDAVAYETTNERTRDELAMRVRIIQQSFDTLVRYRDALAVWRHGLFALQLFSHKVMRYGVAVLLLVALGASVPLRNVTPLFWWACAVQGAVYGSAVVGLVASRGAAWAVPLALPYYFVLANVATLIALVRYLWEGGRVTWNPIRTRALARLDGPTS